MKLRALPGVLSCCYLLIFASSDISKTEDDAAPFDETDYASGSTMLA